MGSPGTHFGSKLRSTKGLKTFVVYIVRAQQKLLLRSVRDTSTFVFCSWIAIQKLLLANVR